MASDIVSPLLNVILLAEGVSMLGLFAYGAYWGFSIRRALSVRLYRNQAFGIGLIAANELLDFINHTIFGTGSPLENYILFLVIDAFITLTWFYWIDASVLAGRRSDPLLRDTLHWRRLRAPLWVLILVTAAIPASVAAYFQLTTGTEPGFVLNWTYLQFTVSSGSQLMLSLAGRLYQFLIAVSGTAALWITALRSGDVRLRRQLEWFAAFIVTSLLAGVAGNTNILVPLFGEAVGNLLFAVIIFQAYCLYRSARSLAPLNRISQEANVEAQTPTTEKGIT